MKSYLDAAIFDILLDQCSKSSNPVLSTEALLSRIVQDAIVDSQT